MSISLRLLAASALTTASVSCMAAAAVEPTAPTQRVEILAPAPELAAARVVLSRPDANATYRMSTGHGMSVTTVDDGVLMRFGHRTAKRLRHDGRGSFVSPNGTVTLQFELDEHGEPQTARLSMPAGWL